MMLLHLTILRVDPEVVVVLPSVEAVVWPTGIIVEDDDRIAELRLLPIVLVDRSHSCHRRVRRRPEVYPDVRRVRFHEYQFPWRIQTSDMQV